MAKIDRYINFMPPVFKAGINPVITALLEAWATEDDEIVQQLKNTNSQLFVRTAEGQFLDRVASGLGVSRPSELGLLDEDFQELVPNLSLKAKQVRKTFYDTMDVFWGELFTRVNVQTINFAPFNVSDGDLFHIKVDGGETQVIRAEPGDIAIPGAATAEEIATILSRIKEATLSIVEDHTTGNEFVNIRTNTPGNKGSLEILSDSTMVGTAKLDYVTDRRVRITDLPQRAVIYEVRDRELIIELPAVVPILRRTLKGSHHFHADATLESPVPPANKTWVGSFFYAPSGVSYTVTSQTAVTEEIIQAGQVTTQVTVVDGSGIPNEPATAIFGWGKNNEEQPVRIIGRPNNKTILLDPAHVFAKTHAIGTNLNILVPDLKPYTPSSLGTDYAIYVTSPAGAREIVQNLLETLIAAGVVINFVILLPEYLYRCKNPYADVT